jgi:tetratricopeptide (TPR) repeat protein
MGTGRRLAGHPVSDTTPRHPSISASIIVKDAATTIVPCLASFVDDVDEVVVVDTGSTDRTVAVVEAYARERAPHVRVEHFAWCDDFSAARSAALAHLTHDWVFWVDADDLVENAGALRGLAAQGAESAVPVGWSLPYEYAPGELIRRVRLVGPRDRWRWQYPVHELLVADDVDAAVELSSDDVRVIHVRAPEAAADHSARNIRVHERHFATCVAAGTLPDARSYLVFAIDLHQANRPEEAVLRYLQAADLTQDADERYVALHSAADCLRVLGRHQEALEFGLHAAHYVAHRPDAYFVLAATALELGDPEASVAWAERGFACPDSDSRYIRADDAYTYWPYVRYVEAQMALDNPAAALAAARKVQSAWTAPEIDDLVARLSREVAPADTPTAGT